MIAVLGYGSLIWDLEILAPHVEGPWQMAGGPPLPMEFSRISPKRRMGLVACLDPIHGVACPTHAIASRRDGVEAAALDLAARERAPRGRIGTVCLASGRVETRLPEVGALVAAWCRSTGRSGAVWTDLDPNFAEAAGRPFSVEAGIGWLLGLQGESRDEAVRYIALAPEATDTPLRRALAPLDWWRAERARLGV
jgi:hypothetical protein